MLRIHPFHKDIYISNLILAIFTSSIQPWSSLVEVAEACIGTSGKLLCF